MFVQAILALQKIKSLHRWPIVKDIYRYSVDTPHKGILIRKASWRLTSRIHGKYSFLTSDLPRTWPAVPSNTQHMFCFLVGERGLFHRLENHVLRLWADSRFASSQWETALLCNDVSQWLGASLESAVRLFGLVPSQYLIQCWCNVNWTETSGHFVSASMCYCKHTDG